MAPNGFSRLTSTQWALIGLSAVLFVASMLVGGRLMIFLRSLAFLIPVALVLQRHATRKPGA